MGQAQTEYVVKFTGDYSALAKDIDKINGATRKLEDDEVIIKLNYDGNIKQFNKVFDEISKKHPELGIQFQYNVNEKLLNQELDKLEKYTQLKLDIDEGNVQGKLEKMADSIESALQNHLDEKDITKLVENYFGYYNTAIKSGAKNINIDEINKRLADAFEIESESIKKIFDNMFDSGRAETVQLFKFDKSLNDDLLTTKERIEDIRKVLQSLKEKGASETGLPSDLQKIQDEIKILRSDIQEMQEQLKDLSGEAFTRMSENIKEANYQLDITKERLKVVQDFLKNNGNSEVLNFTEALNKLQGMLSTFYKENNGNHISSFWDELIQKAQDGDKEVLQLLSDLRLLKDDNLPNKVNAGMVKSGGLIGDDYTVLTTKIRSDKFSGDRLKDAEELKNRLDAISNSGVNAARTLAIVSDEANNLFVEIQQTAPGKMLGQIYGQTDKDWVNMDFLKAEDEEILKLIVDLETLRKAGIGVELNAGNLLYQKGKGFSIIDMDLKPLQDYEETISESQNVLLDSIRQFFEEQTDETGKIKAEAQEAINALDLFSNRFGVIAKEKRELIDRLSTEGANNNQILINDAATEATKEAADAIKKAQDSNSPAELTKPLGQNFTEGYAEGIREAIPGVVQACKEVVLAAYNAMKEASDSEDGETVDLSESFIGGFRKNLENALPTIQEEIQKILSKINVDDDTYTNAIGIGQELIDSVIVGIKNEHSAESFKETIEQVITDAFSNIVLDRATKAIVQQIQSYIDSYTSIDPFVIENFDVNTNSIVVSIQDALNSNKFNINLDGTIKDLSTALNTSANNVKMSFIDAIKWIREANEWQKVNQDKTHERTLFFNTKTGAFSNPTVVGNESSVTRDLAEQILSSYAKKGIKFDTDLHWHLDYDEVAPSDRFGDIDYFFQHAFEESIDKFMIGAQKEIAVFDFSKIASSSEEFEDFLIKWVDDNFDVIKKVVGDNVDVYPIRQKVSIFIDKLYDSLLQVYYEDIEGEFNRNDYNYLTSKQASTAIFDIMRHFETNNTVTDLSTGENLDVNKEFGILKIKLKDKFKDFINRALKDFEYEIALYNDDIINPESIIQKTHKVFDELFSNKNGILKGFEDVRESLEDNFASHMEHLLLTNSPIAQQHRDRRHTDILQRAGSMAMKHLIENNDFVGKIAKYYTHDEFEREFGANIKGVIQKPTKKYTRDDLEKWIGDESGNALALSYGEFSKDYFIEWKEKLLRYFPELLENQVQELFDLMRTTDEFDANYNQEDFYKQYLSKINAYVAQNAQSQPFTPFDTGTQFPFSPTIPEDFQTQIQNAINESGKYFIEVYGKLADEFRSSLSEAIDEIGYFYIDIRGYLVNDFKEVLQEFIDELGAFKIEVKPYMKKGGEIEEESTKYQIEQAAVEELIASLKKKQETEESTKPTQTSATATAMQEEVSVVNAAVEEEKKKFDELKNKISKTIPNAVKKKNEAFEQERDLVAKVIDDEIDYFKVLEDSVNGVTTAIEKQYDTTKNAKPKSEESKKKSSGNKSSEPDRDELLRQHETELWKNYFQSMGQKSQIQQDMSKYYAELEKQSAKTYSDAENKASSLLSKVKNLKSSGKYTQDFVIELSNAEKEVSDLFNALKKGEVPLEEVNAKITQLANDIEETLAKKAFGEVKLAAEKSLTNVGLKIDQIIAKNSAMGEDFKQRFMALRKELEGAKSVEAVQKIVAEVNKLESELIQAGKTGKSFIDQIKQRLRDINSKYIAQYFSFQDIIRYAREAFNAVQELNIQMVELAKVSEQSLSQIEDDFNSYANTAKDLGATISDTISATADWARMGYNVPDAKQLAEVALLYKNVGDGIDITAANQSLISTLQGYQMQADEAEHIVDVFNEVANNYAIDTAGIGEALQRSAASLDAANTSLEQSVALVTAANTVVQNPESVGTTFKTLSARLRGAKTDLEELGEEEDEFTQTTSKLQSLVKGLTGFDILEADQKTYKSIYDILVGIGKEWKNLTDIEQASLGEALFGKRNANVGFAILNNIDTLTSAYETAENAAGSARREQENYEKGIEYSVNKAKAALQELAFDALDSDLLKGLIDMGTNAINLLDTIIDKFGLLKTAIVGIAGVIGSQKLG